MTAQYMLRAKSGTWTSGPGAPRDRLLRFDMNVVCDGEPIGGNNVQVVLEAPSESRAGLDEDVILWVDSGWWVTLRNDFARAREVARQIVGSISRELSAITDDPRGADAAVVFATTFETTGPRHWR